MAQARIPRSAVCRFGILASLGDFLLRVYNAEPKYVDVGPCGIVTEHLPNRRPPFLYTARVQAAFALPFVEDMCNVCWATW